MNYKELWERLTMEMSYLHSQKVSSVSPHIVLSYMGFLEEIERVKEKTDNEVSQAAQERSS